MTKEKILSTWPGFAMLFAFLAVAGVLAVVILSTLGAATAPLLIVAVPVFIFAAKGFTIIEPNMARVMIFFGNYEGTVKESGFFWVNPFYSSEEVSLRIGNLETAHLKVNDKSGNPIEIAAVVVWKVVHPAKAVLDVEDYEEYIKLQAETALRHLGASYAYDRAEGKEQVLRSQSKEITEKLDAELQERLEKAGIDIVESRISHLAYAPEIAGAMLQRQQASAIVDARKFIVDGAVGMVEIALQRIEKKRLVRLSASQKAAMVANLLVVLCSDRGAQPIVSAGEVNSYK